MRFWDASVLVPLCVVEAQSQALRSLREADPDTFIWWGTWIECISALMRSVREGRLSEAEESVARVRLREVFADAHEINPSEDVRARAERLLSVHPLRAADALQLAAALIWAMERPAGLGFVSLDRHLREAARREGFEVLPVVSGV